MTTSSKKVLDSIYKKEIPLKRLAEKAVRKLYIPATFPGGTRIFAQKMQGTIWGKPQQMTMSLLKTDVFDRRFVARKPCTVDQVVNGAFSEANKDFDDMPHSGLIRAVWGVLVEEGGRRDYQAWSNVYPFPCQKPVGQIIIRARDLKGAKQPEGVQSMKNGAASVHMESKNSASLGLEFLISMKRNIVAINASFSDLSERLSFKLYRHQDQGHRKYMDENGNYIPEKERRVVFYPADPLKPLEYYDLEADADTNRPFEPPKSGVDGRFFWVSQRFPAEKTFPDGFEYVMMGLVSNSSAIVRQNRLQKGLGTSPSMPVGPDGKILVEKGMEAYSYLFWNMESSYKLLRNAPGVAATAVLPEAGTGCVQLYVTVVTTNETKDIFAEAKRQLVEAEKMGYEALARENGDWYEALYDRREEGRIVVASPGMEKDTMDRLVLDNAFRSWSISDGGYCDPDPRKYEGSEAYANFDVDAQAWHSLPCYNEVFGEPMIVHNQYEPLMYYCRLIEAWHEALKGKAQAIYGLPGMIIPHGYLPPAAPNPWYIENQTFDFCLEVAGQVVKVMWNMWDYCADEELFKNLIYPVTRDLAIFYEAFARRNFDGRYYNLLPVVETENWGISYQLKHATNTTGAIAMFRKILNCAIEGADLLGVDKDLVPGWREVAENLPPYPKFLVSSGEIFAGNPGAMPRYTSGDHPIFTGDYPATLADEITLDSPQKDKDLIARTNDVVRTDWNKSGYILVGKFKNHIPCSINQPAILIKNSEMLAREVLDQTERLLNSRSGRIYLFPVVPDWSEVAFREFLARGGFVVSAARDKDGVKAVLIKAKRSIPCCIMNPWARKAVAGKKITVTDITANKTIKYELNTDNGECIVFQAEAGHEYSIDMG
jgi:hypothetical protein